MKAAIVYNLGGAQPVARVRFYLLDDDLENILRNAGFKSTRAFDYGLAMRYHRTGNPDQMEAAIRPHIVKSVTTDFDGTAKFDGLSTRTYYLVGVAETRGGFAVWNLKVEIPNTMESVILDQNNAAYAS